MKLCIFGYPNKLNEDSDQTAEIQTCVCFLKLPQGLYYMPVSSKGSGETALINAQARLNIADRLCDKYHFLMCWLIFSCVSGKRTFWNSPINVIIKTHYVFHLIIKFVLKSIAAYTVECPHMIDNTFNAA